MSSKNVSKVLVALAAMLVGVSAHAAACTAGLVVDKQNMTCTIGDLSFSFGAASIRDDSHLAGVTLANFGFTPLTNGFKVTGAFTETLGEAELDWSGVNFSTLSGLATVTGISATTIASFIVGTSAPIAFAEFNESDPLHPSNAANAQPGLGGCPAGTCARNFPLGPVSAVTGNIVALGGIVAAGSRSSVFSTETDFIVNEQAVVGAVPEPSEWALMIGGFGMLGVAARRRMRR